ncbi:hypothetical protein [Xanthomonas phage RTH11]|nr:hypothetical protein [Xanthomonas phage RTH11]
MTQTTTTESPKALFNLIVAPNHATANAIAKQYDLSDVQFLDELEKKLRLEDGGIKRGDSLNAYLASVDHTITLVALFDQGWLASLLGNNSAMSASVWRSVLSKLMGHRSELQRNLLVISADSLSSNVRASVEAGKTRVFAAGQRVPNEWYPARPEREKPVKKEKTPIQQYVEKNLKPRVHAKKNGAPELVQVGLKRKANTPKPSPRRSHNVLHDDLYLLAKGHYGAFGDSFALEKAQQIISIHMGVPLINIGDDIIVHHLFETLIKKSNRGYWGGFTLLKDVVHAGSRGAGALVDTLVGHISLIPAIDAKGVEVKQPKANERLVALLHEDKDRAAKMFPGTKMNVERATVDAD